MVATRRQVQIGPDEELVLEQDPDQLLKKKAVRKPAARTAATRNTDAKSKSTVRGKKIDPETIQEPPKPATRGTKAKKTVVEADPAPTEDEKVTAGRTSTAGKARSMRGRKTTTTTEEPIDEDELVESRPTRSTKPASVRGRKAISVVEESAEEITVQTRSAGSGLLRNKKATTSVQSVTLPAPQEPKMTRSTRGTTKSAPLSPKKITQVSKPPAKTSKQADSKLTAKTTRTKAQSNAKSVGRKRIVSDENAEVAQHEDGVDNADDEEDTAMLPPTPVKTLPVVKRASKQAQPVTVAESEASMSSRATTPSDSPGQSFNTIEEEADPLGDAKSGSEAEQSETDAGDASEDELCGPKTPMRRSSPSALARYQSSVQRTIRKHEEDSRMETPAIRYAVLGTQRGTPQTQKPYCKPSVPTSEARPMTVSRADGRALVFKDLPDGASSLMRPADVSDEQDEPSFVVDEDIIPMETTDHEMNSSFLTMQPHPAAEMDEARLLANSQVEQDAEDYVVPANVQKYSDDPEDTLILQDSEDDMEAPSELAAQPFEEEDTVIATRVKSPAQEENASRHEDETDEDSVIIHPTQPSVTAEQSPAQLIAVNFDEHLKDVRNQIEQASMATDDEVVDAPFSLDHKFDHETESVKIDQDVSVVHDMSRRQTFDLNQFIDFAALSEPTLRIDVEIEDFNAPSIVCQVPDETENVAEKAGTIDYSLDAMQPHQSDTFGNLLEDGEDSNTSVGPEAGPERLEEADTFETPESVEQQAQARQDIEGVEEIQGPHYALPTVAFDARRKSLPVLSMRTPIRSGARPHTSDGASMPRIANPFTNAWWARSGAKSTIDTPAKARPSTAHATPSVSGFNIPVRSRQSAVVGSAVKTPKERYPLFPPRTAYGGHRNTVAAPTRFITPSKESPKRRETFHRAVAGKTVTHVADSVPSTPATPAVATPKERYPALNPRENYEEHAKTVAATRRFQTPAAKSANRRQTFHRALPGQNISITAATETTVTTPVPKTPLPEAESANPNPKTPAAEEAVVTQERYPRLRPQQIDEEHAKTVTGPKRFNTPVKRSAKRPATVGKSATLRFATLAANTPPSSNTPLKTPLKAPAMTPSRVPMTPHPAAPLRAVVALVEVFTLEGASASAPFISLLQRLGARTTRAWNDRITHVVFKDGSPNTLQRVRLNNKEVEETGKGTYIHCVNSRWVTDCDTEGVRVDESGDAYVVDVAEVPRGGKRRRRSMEPAALLNLGGNIVRDRKSSGVRVSSFGRSPLKVAESPAKIGEVATGNAIGKENSGDEQSSPATPAWIAAPSQLVQHTAPMKRVRKLELPGKGESKSRRLTFWNGAA